MNTAIIFDLDDTLYPEAEYVRSGFWAVSTWVDSALDVPAQQTYEELLLLFDTGVRGDTFDRWLRARGLGGRQIVRQLITVYRDHTPRLEPFPDSLPVLSNLGARHRLGIVTDGYLTVQQRKLCALGIADRFSATIFSDSFGRQNWKPSVVPFLAALAQLGVEANRAAYVADNPLKDFAGPRRLGMATVRVRRAGGEYTACEPPSIDYCPDHTIEDLSSLPQVLGSSFH